VSPTHPFAPLPHPPVGPRPAPDERDDELSDAVARLRAVRELGAVRGVDAVHELGVVRAEPDAAAPPAGPAPPSFDDALAGGDELAERLRSRRSASHVAAAYSAAHGHPLGLDEEGDGAAPAGRRWAVGVRSAVVAGVTVVALGLGASAVALRPGGEVEPLAPVAPAEEVVSRPPVPPAASAPSPAPGGAGVTAAQSGSVVVHVVGRVERPGVVTLPAGARVADALEAAGGASGDANLAAVNLARAVVDGEQVYVPAPGEALPPATAPGEGGGGGGGGRSAAPGGGPALVDLNAADAATLETLPGVGPVIAERIVAWREENGPFTSVDELAEVSGIGPAMLATIRDAARV
jgi:competence protein ComEA